MFPVTAIYAGLLGLFFVGLSYAVTARRRSQQISTGDGDDARMRHLARAQGNFAEYAPIGLLLLALCEGAPHLLKSAGSIPIEVITREGAQQRVAFAREDGVSAPSRSRSPSNSSNPRFREGGDEEEDEDSLR